MSTSSYYPEMEQDSGFIFAELTCRPSSHSVYDLVKEDLTWFPLARYSPSLLQHEEPDLCGCDRSCGIHSSRPETPRKRSLCHSSTASLKSLFQFSLIWCYSLLVKCSFGNMCHFCLPLSHHRWGLETWLLMTLTVACLSNFSILLFLWATNFLAKATYLNAQVRSPTTIYHHTEKPCEKFEWKFLCLVYI